MVNKKTVCLLDYGSGNVRSVYNVLLHLGHNVVVSNSKQQIKHCSHLILPGVGSFNAAMRKIKKNLPLECLEDEVLNGGKPFLGICVGMQVLANAGHEFEICAGLGWIPGSVRKLLAADLSLPHIGWNDISIKQNHPIFDKLKDYRDFYFVHSFCFDAQNSSHVFAHTNYGENFNAIVCKDNIFGFQFHPEKSQRAGQLLLNNFVINV